MNIGTLTMRSCLSAFLLILILLSLSHHARAEENTYMRIVAYNVENLFDTKNDSLKNDDDFTPEGAQHWTYYRYTDKLSRIAQVISAIGEWQAPAIIGLVEVETDSCLYDLTRWHLKRRFFPYRYVLHEGPDERGIDPAMLYDSTRLELLHSEAIRIDLGANERPTRDILYCQLATIRDSGVSEVRVSETHASEVRGADTLHVFVCHFPSQRGGAAETEEKRRRARTALQSRTTAILNANPNALIIAMGDFNSRPTDSIGQLTNKMTGFDGKDMGTHKYLGQWTCLDQFWVSPAMLHRLGEPVIFSPDWLLEEDERYGGMKPKRCWLGPRYLGGYSDHLPIYIDFR